MNSARPSRWPCVDTTDGLHAPAGLQDKEAMTMMKRSYQQILKVAEAHKIVVNIEPHGYFTTNPDRMAEMQAFSDSPYLRMNMDTGNTQPGGAGTKSSAGEIRNPKSEIRSKSEFSMAKNGT